MSTGALIPPPAWPGAQCAPSPCSPAIRRPTARRRRSSSVAATRSGPACSKALSSPTRLCARSRRPRSKADCGASPMSEGGGCSGGSRCSGQPAPTTSSHSPLPSREGATSPMSRAPGGKAVSCRSITGAAAGSPTWATATWRRPIASPAPCLPRTIRRRTPAATSPCHPATGSAAFLRTVSRPAPT